MSSVLWPPACAEGTTFVPTDGRIGIVSLAYSLADTSGSYGGVP